MKQHVILVDDQDHQTGTSEKLAAHEQGLLHRAFSAFVFRQQDGELQLLLQQRAADKYHSGGLWTNTCCSHPKPGETVLGAAHRRMQEEFGFDVMLHPAGSFIYKTLFEQGLSEHEYDHVLIGNYQGEDIKPNPEEISNYQWVSVYSLVKSMKKQPENYTAWLKEALNIALEQKNLLNY